MIDKLLKIQIELKAPKNQYNSFGEYRYRSCEDILEAVKPLLKETNSVLLLSDEITEVGERIYVKATATLKDEKDSISVSAFAREVEEKKKLDGSQLTGVASSYARKYALNGLFCIDDTKDADTEEFEHEKNQINSTAKKEQEQAEVTTTKEPTYREKVIDFARRRNIPFTELAKDYGLNASTTEERFAEVLKDLEG